MLQLLLHFVRFLQTRGRQLLPLLYFPLGCISNFPPYCRAASNGRLCLRVLRCRTPSKPLVFCLPEGIRLLFEVLSLDHKDYVHCILLSLHCLLLCAHPRRLRTGAPSGTIRTISPHGPSTSGHGSSCENAKTPPGARCGGRPGTTRRGSFSFFFFSRTRERNRSAGDSVQFVCPVRDATSGQRVRPVDDALVVAMAREPRSS